MAPTILTTRRQVTTLDPWSLSVTKERRERKKRRKSQNKETDKILNRPRIMEYGLNAQLISFVCVGIAR